MPYFFSAENLNTGLVVNLVADEARHLLLSHRVKIGEEVKLQGPNKKRFLAEVVKAGKNQLQLRCLRELLVPSESKTALVLFQAVVAEKALDFILQKGTELGLEKIVLFNAQNSAVQLTKEKFAAKKDRWQKILTEAAKQSERAVWPSLGFVSSGSELINQFKDLGSVYLTDINGGRPNASAVNGGVGIIVGPEGGFKAEEVSVFKAVPNVKDLGLGSSLLRAETAALAALAGVRMIIGY